MQKTLYIFPDTNLFVQCRPLKDLNWKALGVFGSVILVLTDPVIREIDHQKGGQGRLAKRARSANTLIRRLLTEDTIQVTSEKQVPTVVIVSGEEHKPLADLSGELDYSIADDRLIGTVAGYQQAHLDREVAVLSHDTGPLLSAKRLGVPYLQVPDDWLLQIETDEEQKRANHLVAELARYKQAEPVCKIECVNDLREFRLKKHTPLTVEQIRLLMARLEERYPMVTDYGARDPEHRSARRVALAALAREVFKPSIDEEIAKYREEMYPAWLARCQEIFGNLHAQLDELDAMPAIEFRLSNEGSRPANDVLVRFEANGGRFWLQMPSDDDDEEKAPQPEELGLPRPPNAPQGAWVREQPRFMARSLDLLGSTQAMSDLIRPFSSFDQPFVRDPNGFYFKGGRSDYSQRVVELTCQQWRHHDDDEFYEVQLMFTREIGVIKGAITVVVHASNLTNPIVHTQPVSIMIDAADTWAEAEALLDISLFNGFSISGHSRKENS